MSESQRKYAFIVGCVSILALFGVELWQHALAFEFELATKAAINQGRAITPAPVDMRDLTNLWGVALALLAPSAAAQGAGLVSKRFTGGRAVAAAPVAVEQPVPSEAPKQ